MKNIFSTIRAKAGRSQKGFTLIELLIAITIFVIFLTIMSNSFIDIIRAQNVANETREMYSELRNFTDFVNDQMRSGNIDYFCYNQGIADNLDFNQLSLTRCNVNDNSLTILSGDNLRTISTDGLHSSVIKFQAGVPASDGTVSNGTVLVQKFRNIDGVWSPENGYEAGFIPFAFTNLNVKNLRFDIYPKDDSQTNVGDLSTQMQPMVEMAIDVASNNSAVKFNLQFQTMIISRAQ